MKLKHIIFDMDGLIVDSEKVYTEGWFHAAKINQANLSDEVLKNTVGKSVIYNKQRIYDELGDWPMVHKISDDRYAYFYDKLKIGQVPLMPYTEEVLTYLKSSGYTLSVATSSFKPHATRVLEELNLVHFFDYQIFGDQVKETKPSPEIYETVIEMAGFSKSESIVLEDSLTGLRAARSAGLKTIWIPTAENNEKLDENMEVFAQVSHLGEALEIIKHFSQ